MITRMSCAPEMAIVFSLHNKKTPSDEEWDEYLCVLSEAAETLQGNSRGLRALSISDGGGPSARQRHRLKIFMQRHTEGRNLVAVVTSDAIVRGIVKALNWFNPQTRAFAPHELPAAISYLQLTPQLRQALDPALRDALLAYPVESLLGK